jgi:hypothetical protein
MAFPSIKSDEAGTITENTADVLYYSAINPSLSILRSANAPVFTGNMSVVDGESGLSGLGLSSSEITQLQSQMAASDSIYLFKPRYGDLMVRNAAVMTEKNRQADSLMPNYRFLIRVENGDPVNKATQAGKVVLSQLFKIEAKNSDGESVEQFPGTPLFLKLPWTGTNSDTLAVVTSDNGESWNDIQSDRIVVVQPASSESDGYVVGERTI